MLSFSEILWGGDLNSSRYFFVVVGVIMPLKTKVGDVWKDALAPKVKVSSQWKPVTQLWSRRNGGWIAALGTGEIRFINTVARVGASIYQLMGSPTQPGNYVFENHAALTAGSGSFAVRTGIFPAGSTLTIVNKGYIRGKGGNGGSSTGGAGGAGSTAIYLDMSCIVVNAEGFIFGGGGGGGGSYLYYGGTSWGGAGGGGGGGVNGGAGASTGGGYLTINSTSTNGSTDSGGVGGYGTVINAAWVRGGSGGAPGQPGTAGTGSKGSTNLSHSVGQGGPAGAAIARNGYVLTILSGNNTTRIKGPIS